MTITVERVVIFVDGENLKNGLDDNLGENLRRRFKHKIFFEKLAGGRNISDRRHYDSVFPGNKSKEHFLDVLKHVAKVRVRLGTTRQERTTSGPKTIQKGVDVLLASDMLVLAMIDYYDTAILVSNDSDFVPAIEYVREVMGKDVEVALMMRTDTQGRLRITGHELLQCATPRVLNQEFLRACLR